MAGAGAGPAAPVLDDDAPVIAAVMEGDLAAVTAWLDSADGDATARVASTGWTLLHCVACTGHADGDAGVAELLLQRGADPLCLSNENDTGTTPLTLLPS